jgi:hypothetical protein
MAAVDAVFAGRESARRRRARVQQDVWRSSRGSPSAHAAQRSETITLREGDRLMRDIGVGLDAARRAAAADRRRRRNLRSLRRRSRHACASFARWTTAAVRQRTASGTLIAMAEAIVASLKSEEEAGKTSTSPRPRGSARAA